MFNKGIEVTFFDLDKNAECDFYFKCCDKETAFSDPTPRENNNFDLKCCDKETAFSDPTPRENFDWSLLVEGDKLTDLERYSSISSDMTSICSAEINDIIDLFEISLENKSINITPKENIDLSKS
jgi:hypothetical protein